MKPAPHPIPRRVMIIRNLVHTLRVADTYEKRDPIIKKLLRLLDLLEKAINPAERGRKGGTKTAERGPDYFRRIAAMRKTKAGGRPKER